MLPLYQLSWDEEVKILFFFDTFQIGYLEKLCTDLFPLASAGLQRLESGLSVSK